MSPSSHAHMISAIALQEQETGSSQHTNDNVDVTYTSDHEGKKRTPLIKSLS